ncbi:hypothetical protein GIB67_020829 [Kingdonia uniflora]|uniref:Uncharacterized protein n=1 Tax=Kingdonia uniflora TaxID=39325 RepID=A0A7J7M7A5_9MAGN|nr:hypothetical protein GIB67_020829 [Kingdonia uniflora]
MARIYNIIPKQSNPFQFYHSNIPRTFHFVGRNFRTRASSRKNDSQPHLVIFSVTGKIPKARRRLITIPTSGGRWQGEWISDYILSLKDLELADLAENGQKDAQVFVSFNVEKHASFGFSVEGRINTLFTSKCVNCSSVYCREINTTFDVWLLQSSKDNHSSQLPEIGGDDPSVIYVTPGCEAELDSVIQDAIRLAASVKETCSDSCEKAESKWQYIGRKEASVDGRWSKLLELRKTM